MLLECVCVCARPKETLTDMGLPSTFNIRDPGTYRLPEVEAVLNRYGVVGSEPLWTKTCLRNRCHPNVIKAYQVRDERCVLSCHVCK